MVGKSSFDDIDLVNDIKWYNDEDSLNELINRHSPLCYKMFDDYSHYIQTSGESIHDVFNERDHIIYKSALNYDPSKSKYSTFLANQIKYRCLRSKNIKIYNHIEEDEDELMDFEEYQFNPELLDLKDTIFNQLQNLDDWRYYWVFQKRYLEDKTWKEIGNDLDISYETARQLHRRGIEFLKDKLLYV